MSLPHETDIITLLMVFYLFIIKANSSGVAILRLIKYENPSGKGANGNCCDSYWGYCSGRSSYCDYYFVICLDRPDGNRSLRSCAIGSKRTGTLSNTNVVVFGRSIGGTPNPLRFPFNRWYPNGIRIKIDVYDDDSTGSDDFVQYYNRHFPITPGNPTTITFNGRTRLLASLEVVCDKNWYGNECNTFCVPQQDDFLGHFNCSETGQRICHVGWTGSNCMNNIDECQSSPCGNRGRCQDALNSYYCNCYYGYAGQNCETITDHCVTEPCRNNGSCTRVGAGYTCTCPQGFRGTNCEEEINYCGSLPCQNNGTCTQQGASFVCQCMLGFEGQLCQVNTDECSDNPCEHGGTCQDLVNDYKCLCLGGFTGKNCEVDIDECDSKPCQNAGSCEDGVDSYACHCAPGFSGRQCEQETNECASFPCLNGGICRDLINTFACQCADGFTGTVCEVNIDDCPEEACTGNGNCTDGVSRYYCHCDEGWTGSDCEVKLSPCSAAPCRNNGTCVDRPNGYSCSCLPGFGGAHCDAAADPCLGSPCQWNGTCSPDGAGYVCLCDVGRTGRRCEADVDECQGSPCENNGTCVNAEPGYRCLCPDAWTGDNCATEVDPCITSPCQNEIEVQVCDDSFCKNGGTCQQIEGRHTCICSSSYTGPYCQYAIDVMESSEGFKSLHFRGRLGIYESKIFLQTIASSVANRLNISERSLRIVHEIDYCEDDRGTTITILRFQIRTAGGTAISRAVYDDIFNELSKPGSKGILPLPLHHGDCYQRPKVAESTQEKQSWMKKNWPLLAAIGAVLFIVGAAMLAAMKLSRCRRRSTRDSFVITANPTYEARPSVASTEPLCGHGSERNAGSRASYMGTEPLCGHGSERNAGSRASYMGTERFHDLERILPGVDLRRK